METAIQELIKDFEAIDKDGYNIEPKAAIELCKQRLAKEKEQIRKAYKDGVYALSGHSVDSENYFDQTYTTKK